MNQYELLGRAIEVATQAHAGQFDKGGKPYILHPLHLMNQLMFDIELAQIAVMHDVVEDSDYYTLDILEKIGFSKRVIHDKPVRRVDHISGQMVSGNHPFRSFRTYHQSDRVFRIRFWLLLSTQISVLKH